MSAKEKNRKRLFLIDGPAIYYRAYFAFIRNPLINSHGENTSATFGFTNSTLKILRDEKPDYIAVIFDTKEPTFRHQRYSEYKANRETMPEELVEQLPRIDSVIDALNIPSYKLVGYEADDIMGAFTKKAEALGIDVFLVTGDKDMCQLVSDHVKIYNPGRGGTNPETMDEEGVTAKWGVRPNQIIDFLALTGDSSDNVPGVAGVGPKTAASLLNQFDTLDELLERTSEIKAAGVRSKIESGKENALLSRELVTLCLDVPLKFDLEELEAKEADYEKTRALFRELEFNSALKALFPHEAGDNDSSQEETSKNGSARASLDYTLVSSLKELTAVVEELNKLTEVAIDTETTSLNPIEAELVGISLCARAGKAYYIPVGHKSQRTKNIPIKKALKELEALFLNENIQKTGQNIKYDLHVLRNAGAEIRNVGFDTMVAAYTLNPSVRKYSLDFLAQDQFDYAMKPISDLIGKGKDQKSFAEVSVDDAVFYACEDTDYTYRLRGTLESDLERTGLDSLYEEIENPLIPVLMEMESTGVIIDSDFLNKMSDELEKNLDTLKRDIYKSANGEFNINSPKQLAKILFDDLKLPTGRKTSKTGGYSTDANTLEELAGLHPLPKLLLDYRQLNKLKSTYVDALPTMVNARTGRVHTTFNQTIAATGRLSSTDPNLQNIPIRTEIGREIRRAFIPKDKNYRILTADYSQIELRILASVSGDKNLIKAFKKGEDIHNRTAAEVYGVALDEVTDEQRRLAKTANFAVIYGVSAYGLSQQSDLDVSAAKEFIDTYFKRYPGIQSYMDETLEFAQKMGYVETLSGRRRYIPDINAKNRQIRQFAERTAINTRIQGAAADMIKLAMIALSRTMSGMKSKMILQVHDELVFDAHVDEIARLTDMARSEMETALKLKVPIIVDIGCGQNWLEAKS